jgi:DNA polymerase elongation subunit (family B)
MESTLSHSFKLFDFNFFNKSNNETSSDDSNSDEDFQSKTKIDTNEFMIQMFGVNEIGDTCSILVYDFKPFFYIKVSDDWTLAIKERFLQHLKKKVGKYYENSIVTCKLIKRKKLYEFDAGKEYKFIYIQFKNIQAFNKVKNLWYYNEENSEDTEENSENKNKNIMASYAGLKDTNEKKKYGERKLYKNGYTGFENYQLYLYESNIPPLLRFFHINDISPSGWIELPSKTRKIKSNARTTSCTYEYIIHYKNIISCPNKETAVPYKICSYDIEASSSHGDFPLPIKSYKKLATNIVDYFDSENALLENLEKVILSSFGIGESILNIECVYPKSKNLTSNTIREIVQKVIRTPIKNTKSDAINTIDKLFESMYSTNDNENDHDPSSIEESSDSCEVLDSNQYYHKKVNQKVKKYNNKNATMIDILNDKSFDRESKIFEICGLLDTFAPSLEGDKVTFIGSTFVKYGKNNNEPYLNHCIALNTCDQIESTNEESQTIIESYQTEKEVLLAWKKLIQIENPDIIIGYNIFGFDYTFLHLRARECDCEEEFLKLSRNNNELCGNVNDRGSIQIEESSIQIASGTHELKYIKMNGRIQIDLYNYFRREENLVSYKLDYVAGYFIGDYVKQITYINGRSRVKTNNMLGLMEDSFIHLEEIGHTIDYYKGGAKFKVSSINKEEGWFEIDGEENPDMKKKVRWCLAKDDVTPKDIFRLSNGSSKDRSIIAKYCIQDCNLVHYLFNKVDILTGLVEMSKICSVPINFLIMRGQGIKLTSYVSKKCREKGTLMPVIDKSNDHDGYEGAIVLEPKCNLYLDNPIPVGDFASLYPSSMLSENISHDSKVWTKEYDLQDVLIKTTGQVNESGNFIYDNLPGYEYVDITYDTFKYVRKSPSAAAQKIKCGYKICRYAQFPEEKGRAIMPSILQELLSARKSTRKLIPLQNDAFMKNVLDKRQLAYKLTANSLYGQCGAKTSTFYDKDIAASTTATGRLLLTYSKKIVEECYGDNICDTKLYGQVRTKAEYVYGDTDSVFFNFNLTTLQGEKIIGDKALEISIEIAQEATHLVSKFLKQPHDFEYEKTFMPFCLLSKKRYVGILYELDPKQGKRKEMGIVLKRRDNAPIVKDVYGGIIDILMKEKNIQKAIEYLRSCLKNIVDEKCPMDKLIITKSLNSFYKNPKQIAHKVLADRITTREPGNKPTSGDRIPFVYIHTNNKKALQGDKIETPTFIKENNLKIDYSFYITNQIMKPVQQLFGLVLEDIWKMQNKLPKIKRFHQDVEMLRSSVEDDKFEDKLESLRNKEIKALLFDEYLRTTNNSKTGNQSILTFFKSNKK